VSWLHRLGDRLSPKNPITAEATPISPAVQGVLLLGMLLIIFVSGGMIIFGPSVEQRNAAKAGASTEPPVYKPKIATIGERISLTPLGAAIDGPVLVWKSFADQEEGSALARAGASQILVLQHIACIVPAGTEALVRDISILNGGAPTITVLDGPHMGCKGIIRRENVMHQGG
jgi:hypothetical protein